MRTRVRLSAVCLCLALLSAACSSQSPARKTDPDQARPDSPTTIRVAYARGYSRAMDVLIQGFQQTHTQYRVETVSLESGSPPEVINAIEKHGADVLLTNSIPIELAAGNRVADLFPYIQKDGINLDAYRVGQSQLLLDGRVFGLPVLAQPRVLMGNADMFEKAGVPLPSDGWTWDEFRNAAVKLTSPAGNQWALPADDPEYLAQMHLLQHTNGAPAWKAGQKAWHDVMQLWSTLVLKDRISPPVKRDTKGPLQRGGSSPEGFRQGQSAMTLWMLTNEPRFGFKAVILPVPSAPGKNGVLLSWYQTLSLSEKSQNPDAAWEFVRYATGPEGALVLATAKSLPMYATPESDKAWQDGNLPGSQHVFKARWTSHWGAQGAGGGYDERLRQLMDDTINTVLSGTTGWEEGVAEFETRSKWYQ